MLGELFGLARRSALNQLGRNACPQLVCTNLRALQHHGTSRNHCSFAHFGGI